MARFEDLRYSLWDTGGGYTAQPPLTEEAIAKAQRLLDVTLPGSLLDLLRHRNGGEVAKDWNAFPVGGPTSWSTDHVPFDRVMGIGGREGTLSLLDSPYLVGEWGSPPEWPWSRVTDRAGPGSTTGPAAEPGNHP
ncbi:SMI1/KNR4 family protein [Nocardiopsis sp. EMB25]|uniref:SMI1/KNR4 family protein n=1 Tax=Nocardiopsis sp. EMB25 TaxID=2835867 RepID=UPI0022850D47|nr:SMI1/KNR4 family protein [Nocardiopsis sp. EMB25]MCY9785127.1 SMI1/KNR4 family protein [Nocardiopsis sp. EMB25]